MYSIFRPELHEAGLAWLAPLQRYLAGHLAGDELEALRRGRFEQVLARAREGSAFYRRHLEGVAAPSPGETLAQAVRRLPFTTKQHLSAAGMSLCSGPLDEAWVYYETTGTTGPATPCPRNEVDSLVNNAYLALQYRAILAGRRHVVGVMGPTELQSTGDTFEDVCRSLGHTVVKMWPRSPVVGMARVLRLIRELRITALVCTPAVAAEMLKHARAQGVEPRELGVEVILVLGELVTPNRLRNLARHWNARMYNCMYASQESSILAACSDDSAGDSAATL